MLPLLRKSHFLPQFPPPGMRIRARLVTLKAVFSAIQLLLTLRVSYLNYLTVLSEAYIRRTIGMIMFFRGVAINERALKLMRNSRLPLAG
jgi:hypothetical protein